VAALLMQQVFGSTELVVGLHARKLVCALDMYDWEESGATTKEAIKMSKIPAERFKKSLATWLPKGERRAFQDTMEALGSVLGENRVGMFGKMQGIIIRHNATKNKKQMTDMVEKIIQFYKVTKSGGKRRSCVK
jgi:hypothetical protein